MTRSVGIYDAKTQLPRLVSEVEKGDTITITRHGKAVAQIIPIDTERDQEAMNNKMAAVERLRSFRLGRPLDGMSVRELIEEGRR